MQQKCKNSNQWHDEYTPHMDNKDDDDDDNVDDNKDDKKDDINEDDINDDNNDDVGGAYLWYIQRRSHIIMEVHIFGTKEFPSAPQMIVIIWIFDETPNLIGRDDEQA